MSDTGRVRRARSQAALEKLLASIEAGREPSPDWIALEGDCRLDRVAEPAREALVRRLHACVHRGFRANNVSLKKRKKRLAYWQSIARNGFHDFSEAGWRKSYDSPFVHDYDYVRPYLESGLRALDSYEVYSAVLGTHDYSVEDFVSTDLCRDVKTIVEPMAGSAEFAYHGHFHYPDFRYVMIDLDSDARKHVLGRPWLPDVEHHYVVSDVLEESVWQQVKSLTTGKSLSYIGKQSHHFFDARQLHHLLGMATKYVDYFMLEVPEVSLVSDVESTEDLSRPEMEDAGFSAGLVDAAGGEPNPLTNRMSFELRVWDRDETRTLFRYHEWTSWQAPILVAMADLLGLNVYYHHHEPGETGQFLSVHDTTPEAEYLENVTFMVFTRESGYSSPVR